MDRRMLLKQLGMAVPAYLLATKGNAMGLLNGSDGYMAKGRFKPTWNSLQGYQVPDWYKNAKFGIWAHWGPQCQPEYGDWYARGMYEEGSDQYNYHVKKYGHPSKFGFKDVIHEWQAEAWNPEELVNFYKGVGAKYFFCMANHHDNLDLWNSKHHYWNSVNLGPKKDIVGGWAKAAKKAGLPFGVSVHAAHAWTWYETAQHADKKGPLQGVPYDGKLTKADGKGLWWEGLDPQDLYAQNHPLSSTENNLNIHAQWHWGNGVAMPSKAYCELFYKRTIELIDKYEPELIYFDDTVLPFHPINDIGLKIAAHHYNKSIQRNGRLDAVVFGKILDEMQRRCLVWDIERGQSNVIEPFTWQTDTCLGNWHYDKRVYDRKGYKSARTVVQTLVDVVSKNGNFLLNVPVKGNGSIDEQERAILEEVAAWMQVNSECIYDTTPWKVLGEGPAMENAAPLSAQGFNEGKGKRMGATDIRFTLKGNTLYAVIMGWPEDGIARIKSLSAGNTLWPADINRIQLLGGPELTHKRSKEELAIQLPDKKAAQPYAVVLKIV